MNEYFPSFPERQKVTLRADSTLAIKRFPPRQPRRGSRRRLTTEFRLKRSAKVRVTLRTVTAHERLGFRRWKGQTDGEREGGRVKVGENQSGLAKVATLDRGRQRRRNREGGRESYPLSGDLGFGPAESAADSADRADRQTQTDADAHMALQSDEGGWQKMLRVRVCRRRSE